MGVWVQIMALILAKHDVRKTRNPTDFHKGFQSHNPLKWLQRALSRDAIMAVGPQAVGPMRSSHISLEGGVLTPLEATDTLKHMLLVQIFCISGQMPALFSFTHQGAPINCRRYGEGHQMVAD